MTKGKIFMTGGSGFIGSHFHEVLDEAKITNIDLKKPLFDFNSNLHIGNIRNIDDVRMAIGNDDYEVIISLAAEHKDFGLSEEEYFLTNEHGTKVICQVASEKNIKKIIYYSSVAVYGNNLIPSTEEMEPNPNLPYGASKLAGEKVLQKWVSEDKERSVLVIRPTVVYGERNVANMFRLIQQINMGRYFHIGDGKNIKSIAYVKNLVAATIYLMDKMKPGMEVYNFSDDPQLTSREIATVISDSLTKRKPFTIPYSLAYMMGIPFDLLIKITGKDLPISTNRIKKFCTETFHKSDKLNNTGFTREYTNIDGLNRMVKWQVEQYSSKVKYYNV